MDVTKTRNEERGTGNERSAVFFIKIQNGGEKGGGVWKPVVSKWRPILVTVDVEVKSLSRILCYGLEMIKKTTRYVY